MLTTEFNGIQYVFDEDRLFLNGIPLLYSEISNISHRGGTQPAFVFDYKGRRYVLPYHPAELQSILPYFVHAKSYAAAPAPEVYVQEEAPAPEPYYEEPAVEPYYQEPAPETYHQEPAQDPYYQEPIQEPYYQEPSVVPEPYYQEPAQDPYYQEEYPAPAVETYYQEPAPEPYVEEVTLTPVTFEPEPVATQETYEPEAASISDPYYNETAPASEFYEPDPAPAPTPEPYEYEEVSVQEPYGYEEVSVPESYEYEDTSAPVEYMEAPVIREEPPAPEFYAEEAAPALEAEPEQAFEEVQRSAIEDEPEPITEKVVIPVTEEEALAPETYEYEDTPDPEQVLEEVLEPAPDIQEEPDIVTDEEFAAAISDEFAPALDEEIAPALDEEDAPPLDEEPAPKKKLTRGKIIVGASILAIIVALAIIFFIDRSGGMDDISDSDITSEEEYYEENDGSEVTEDVEDAENAESPPPTGGTFEATDGFTVTDPDGTMDIKLKKIYAGDEALQKLGEIGEDKKAFEEEAEAGYRLYLYEYESTVKDGSMIGDTITGEMFLSDQKTEFDDWWPVDLTNNTDKDLSTGDIEVHKGETATVYIAYFMPEDLKEYYEKVLVDENETEIWVHYVLGK